MWTRIHKFNGMSRMMIKVHTCVRDCDIMFHVPLAVANFNFDNFFLLTKWNFYTGHYHRKINSKQFFCQKWTKVASIGQLGKILCCEATIASERKRISGCPITKTGNASTFATLPYKNVCCTRVIVLINFAKSFLIHLVFFLISFEKLYLVSLFDSLN